MEQNQTLKICGYSIDHSKNEKQTILTTDKGFVTWETPVTQIDHKPTNEVVTITGVKNNGTQKTFLKETNIMVTLKKAMDWVEKGPDEETLKEELKTSPEPTQDVTEPIKEETKQETIPENTGNNQEDIRNPDGTIKKGHSLNPAGKPKGARSKFLTETLLKELRKEYGKVQKDDGTVEVITNFQQMIREAIKHAMKGDVKYYNSIFDRVEGKPKEEKELKIVDLRELQDEEREELDELITYADNESNQE